LVTKKELEKLLQDETVIDGFIKKAFAEVFYGDNTQRKFTIEGKNQIIFDVIKKYLLTMLKKDQTYAPFSIIGLEKNVDLSVPINVEKAIAVVKIGGMIDRVDRSDKGLRIIDYKTGSDKLIFGALSDVFDSDKIKDTKAIFQTFLYSFIISDEFSNEKAILPMVYQVKQLFDDQNSFEISSKKHAAFQSGNFLDIKEEVGESLKQVLEELFNKDQSFVQTENVAACEYCPYKNMCGR
jgi:ATP-dependent helicase/DNAse subunit B